MLLINGYVKSQQLCDGAIAGTAAEKYIAEEEIFNDKIMQKEKPGLIYLYNAVDNQSREFLANIESIEHKFDDLVVNRVDVYKSTGIAEKLNVETFPSVVITKDGVAVNTITEMCADTIANTISNL